MRFIKLYFNKNSVEILMEIYSNITCKNVIINVTNNGLKNINERVKLPKSPSIPTAKPMRK